MESKSVDVENWTMRHTQDHLYYHTHPNNNRKLCTSYSTPLSSTNYLLDEDELQERHVFLKEISQVKDDILRFRAEMNGLAKQMNGMEIDLNHSRNRVREIENGLTATQEVNVNLQVMLENAVHKQMECDVYATQTMKHLYTNLVNVVNETKQLRGRLTTIADYQRHYQGNATDVAERIREYSKMLEQAQGTIQTLKTNRMTEEEEDGVIHSLEIKDKYMINSRRTSEASSYSTEEDEDSIKEMPIRNTPPTLNRADMYRHRIITKRASNPDIGIINSSNSWLPQKGLRILLVDYNGLKL